MVLYDWIVPRSALRWGWFTGGPMTKDPPWLVHQNEMRKMGLPIMSDLFVSRGPFYEDNRSAWERGFREGLATDPGAFGDGA